MRQILARIPKAMLNPIPKLRRNEFGRTSRVTLFASVRMYQLSVRLGIERRIEKGMRIPEMIGKPR